MEIIFSEWLAAELEKRNMRQVDLARKSGVKTSQISRILSGQRGAESKTLYAIARGLKLPPEQVFRAAGLLPPDQEVDPWVEEMSHKLNQLPPSFRSIATRFIDSLVEGTENDHSVKPKRKSSCP